ncbi:nuclear transport factor 2 family protein [Burkholderia sp. Ac-20365]|uniref:nuclear transport factor 2 family protein n=1 Tax=Burkholderia sp. Ac-20365 TaxID=2703897 RepID=UPI00197B8122|nr:nuclear transport factor 2 family protein [Burkholderia sp. Ac-20365]MBN3764155.1 nuclear transport factor 2 family protein [Burkholderia sp. Ac-20365]
MKLHLLCAAPVLAAFGFSASGFASQEDEAMIRRMENTWIQASMQQDRDTLQALLDDSYRGVMPSGATRSKRDVLSTPPAPAGSRQILRDLEIRVYGDRAVAIGESQFMAPDGQQAVFAFKDDFARRDGQWRVVGSWMTRR